MSNELMKIISTGTLEMRTCITQEPYLSNSMETHGLKLHSTLSSFHPRTLQKRSDLDLFIHLHRLKYITYKPYSALEEQHRQQHSPSRASPP